MIGKLLLGAGSQSNNEGVKVISTAVSIGTFIFSLSTVFFILLIGIVLVLVPSVFLFNKDMDGEPIGGFDLEVYYQEVCDTIMAAENQKYVDSVVEKEGPDVIEVDDFTYLTPELLISIDSVLYQFKTQDLTKNIILNNANRLMTRTYDVSHIEDTRSVSESVTDETGEAIIVDPVSGKTRLDQLRASYPGGTTFTSGGITYYRYSEDVTVKKVVVSLNTLSLDEAMAVHGFDEEQRELGLIYYTFSMVTETTYTGESGNYKVTSPTKLFVVPIEVNTDSDTYVRMTSGFGNREYMYRGKKIKGMHNGIDFGLPVGTPLVASMAGEITRSGPVSGSTYGTWIEVKHADGYVSRYAHLSRTLVKVGDMVSQGQKIALSGNTGRSTGPHLHFEIRKNGNPIDPIPYLNMRKEESQ